MNIWREVRAGLFTAVGLLLALSVIEGRNWPLLSGPRAGIVALGVFGIAACASSGMASEARIRWQSPLLLAGFALGVVVLGAAVIGLFANSAEWLLVMMVATASLWLVATARHIVSTGQRQESVRVA